MKLLNELIGYPAASKEVCNEGKDTNKLDRMRNPKWEFVSRVRVVVPDREICNIINTG